MKASACLCFVMGVVLVLGYLGNGSHFSLPGLMTLVHDMSWKGVLLYVACATVGVAFFLPSTPLAVAGGLVFGPWVGFFALQVSSLAAACVIFAVVRIVKPLAGDRLRNVLPVKMHAKIHNNALALMVYARTFMVPDPAVNYGASALSITFREYFLGTLLGSLPHNLALILLLDVARDALLRKNPAAVFQWELIPALLIAASGIILVHLLKRPVAG